MKPKSMFTIYREYLGKTEVPLEYSLWACISMVANLLRDRVWYEKHPGKKLYPNLYVFLVGPSGSGKSHAIKDMNDLVKKATLLLDKKTQEFLLKTQFSGRVTDKGITQALRDTSTERKTLGKIEELTGCQLYIVMEELRNGIESARSDELLALLTELYKGETDYADRNSLRTIKIGKSLVNWLAASTEEWLIRTLGRDFLYSGTMARICLVRSRYNYLGERITFPVDGMADNREELESLLVAHILKIWNIEGEYKLSKEAKEIMDYWYQHRKSPSWEFMGGWWRKEQDLAYQIGIILSAMENTKSRTIEKGPLVQSLHLLHEIRRNLPITLGLASADRSSYDIEAVGEIIKKSKKLTKTQLTRTTWNRGKMDVKKRVDPALEHLKASGLVLERQEGRTTTYEWIDEEALFKQKGRLDK